MGAVDVGEDDERWVERVADSTEVMFDSGGELKDNQGGIFRGPKLLVGLIPVGVRIA